MNERNVKLNNIIVVTIIAAAVIFGCWKLFFQHRSTPSDMCMKNLRMIAEAKQQAALELHLNPGDTIPLEKLYLYQGWPPRYKATPKCSYQVNAIGTPPTCSVPGHFLPK